MALDTASIHVVADEAELRAIIGSPNETVLLKLADRLNGLTQTVHRALALPVHRDGRARRRT